MSADYNNVPQGKDPALWHLARKRAAFRHHAVTYIAVNAFLWILWLANGAQRHGSAFPWPLWPTMGWGLGLFFNYLGAYRPGPQDSIEREYNKLQDNLYKK